MHGLGGVQASGVLWLAQRNDSLHIGFGESEKSWKALSREQIRQLSSFRQPAMDQLVLKHSLLLAFIPAPCHSLQPM